MAMVGIQGDIMAGVGTTGDTTVVLGIQAVITTVTVRGIIPVGTAGGVMGIIPVDIGGALGAMLIQAGGGLIPPSIYIPIPILIPMMCLHRRVPKNLPYIASSRNSLSTGTTARIRRATIHMLRTVREAGHRWNQDQPRPNRKGGHDTCSGDGVFY